MSEAVRAVALAEANKLIGGTSDANAVVGAATIFLAFMQGGAGAPPKTFSAGTEPAPVKESKPSATTATGKPAATTAVKPAKATKPPKKTEEELAAEALKKANEEAEAEEEAEEESPQGPFEPEAESVGKVVSGLIKAGKRQDAINLLKKYKAASTSGLIEKGDATIAKFVADGNTLLGFESEPDLES
jgi:outer membrane biosynthesis protein TonB